MSELGSGFMRIGIIGAGSVGLLMCYYLQKHHEVTLYVRREEQKQKLITHGLRLDQQPPVRDIDIKLSHELINHDLLMICVKQYQLDTVINQIKQHHIQADLLFLQNGMGHVKLIQNLDQPVYLGVVEHGAYRIDEHIVAHTGKGKIKLAAYSSKKADLDSLYEQLHREEFPFELVSNWYDMLIDKLVVNAVINPLTTLFQIKNGEIINNPFVNKLAYKLCSEITHLLDLDLQEQWQKVQQIALTTSENTSSMLSDLNAHRPTEIDAITGYLLHKAKHSAPLNSFLYHSIKALEVKKGIDASYA